MESKEYALIQMTITKRLNHIEHSCPVKKTEKYLSKRITNGELLSYLLTSFLERLLPPFFKFDVYFSFLFPAISLFGVWSD